MEQCGIREGDQYIEIRVAEAGLLSIEMAGPQGTIGSDGESPAQMLGSLSEIAKRIELAMTVVTASRQSERRSGGPWLVERAQLQRSFLL